MDNNIATVNGLMDGISVLEKNIFEQPSCSEDILYNDKEPVESLQDLYYDEGFTVSEYNTIDFGEPITLLSTTEETFKI